MNAFHRAHQFVVMAGEPTADDALLNLKSCRILRRPTWLRRGLFQGTFYSCPDLFVFLQSGVTIQCLEIVFVKGDGGYYPGERLELDKVRVHTIHYEDMDICSTQSGLIELAVDFTFKRIRVVGCDPRV
jgi:hypothetical protein